MVFSNNYIAGLSVALHEKHIQTNMDVRYVKIFRPEWIIKWLFFQFLFEVQ